MCHSERRVAMDNIMTGKVKNSRQSHKTNTHITHGTLKARKKLPEKKLI